MRILAQRLKDGYVSVVEAPSPVLEAGFLRVRTLHSAVSPGTEGGKVIVGRKSLLGKAKAKPRQVRQTLDMVRSLGLGPTIRKVKAKLEGAEPLGYSLCGQIIELGEGVSGLEPGQTVACAGGGYANHATEVVVPVNLVAQVPEGVDPAAASFATLGAIALQGIRVASPTIGESAVVIGLGILGQLACQLLGSGGCRVLGLDISAEAVQLSLSSGSASQAAVIGSDSIDTITGSFTRGDGADLVLICAGTASNDPIELAGKLCRKKGRVVVVGAVGMDIPREDYYRKELAFTVSCSYGPGRYDPGYEEHGLDYPLPYVRWTEGRNLTAILDTIASGGLRPVDLVTHRLPFEEAPKAYEMIATGGVPYCGILLDYPTEFPGRASKIVIRSEKPTPAEGTIGLSVIGAGSFAQSFLLPELKKLSGIEPRLIATGGGLSAADVGERIGFAGAVDSIEAIMADEDTTAVLVASRHDGHAEAVEKAIRAGKHVFVEKPLCISEMELGKLISALEESAAKGPLPILQVGFNRRFSPAAARLRAHFGSGDGPLMMHYRINAGRIPEEHWIQDREVGGGRVVGEVCHFIDLLQFICHSPIGSVYADALPTGDASIPLQDNSSVQLAFTNGSIGTIHYVSEGGRKLPKERIEVSGRSRSAVIDNFRSVELYDSGRRTVHKTPGKGFREELSAFVSAVRSGEQAIELNSQLATTLATFRVLDSLASGSPQRVDLASIGSGRE